LIIHALSAPVKPQEAPAGPELGPLSPTAVTNDSSHRFFLKALIILIGFRCKPCKVFNGGGCFRGNNGLIVFGHVDPYTGVDRENLKVGPRTSIPIVAYCVGIGVVHSLQFGNGVIPCLVIVVSYLYDRPLEPANPVG